jgi:hypothetical protein
MTPASAAGSGLERRLDSGIATIVRHRRGATSDVAWQGLWGRQPPRGTPPYRREPTKLRDALVGSGSAMTKMHR